jgi:hypothetical protein
LSEAKNVGSNAAGHEKKETELFRLAQHDRAIWEMSSLEQVSSSSERDYES